MKIITYFRENLHRWCLTGFRICFCDPHSQPENRNMRSIWSVLSYEFCAVCYSFCSCNIKIVWIRSFLAGIFRGVSRIMPNISDKTFCEYSQPCLAVNYLHQKSYHRCLTRNVDLTHQTFICSKSALETLEKGVKYVQD